MRTPDPVEYAAARFLRARRLPVSAAFSNHAIDSSGTVPESRTPRLHMATVLPASAALLRWISAADASEGTPSPTINMYPTDDAAWASPRSEASARSSTAFAGSLSTPSPSRYLVPSSLRDAASLLSVMPGWMAYSLITGPMAPEASDCDVPDIAGGASHGTGDHRGSSPPSLSFFFKSLSREHSPISLSMCSASFSDACCALWS